MSATGIDRPQYPFRQRTLAVTSTVACIVVCILGALALPACHVKKDGTGYLGDGGGRDGQDAGTQPPNVARVDGGDMAPGRDTLPAVDVLITDSASVVDTQAPDLVPPSIDAPPDRLPRRIVGPPPECLAGDRRCNGKIPESCSGGVWTLVLPVRSSAPAACAPVSASRVR